MNARFATSTGGLALIVAGLLSVRGAFERWWPHCTIGNYDTPTCFALQDHKHDHLVTMAPWEPVGSAATWQGAGLLVLAFGVLCLMSTLGWRTPARVLLQLGIAVVVGSIAVVGFASLQADVSGVAPDGTVLHWAVWIWAVVGPLVFAGVAFVDSVLITKSPPPDEFRRTPWVLLALTTPIAFAWVALIFTMYGSHDTAPWTEAVFGWLMVAAGVTALVGLRGGSGLHSVAGDPLDRVEVGAAYH